MGWGGGAAVRKTRLRYQFSAALGGALDTLAPEPPLNPPQETE